MISVSGLFFMVNTPERKGKNFVVCRAGSQLRTNPEIKWYTDLKFFGVRADLAEKFLKKGRVICLTGVLDLDKWTNKAGEAQEQHTICVHDFDFVNSGARSQEDPVVDPEEVPDEVAF